MKIAFDAKRAYCNNTGLGNYSRMFIEGIARQYPDDELHLYTPRIAPHYVSLWKDYPNIICHTPSGLWRLLPSLWRTVAILRDARRRGCALFHGLSHEVPMGRAGKMKVVVTMHDLIVRRYPHYFSPIDRIIHRIKQRYACRKANMVVAISEQTKRDIVDMMHVDESKIRVVYQSCDNQFWREVSDEEVRDVREKYGLKGRYVVSIGTVEQRKNQLLTVEAMKRVDEDVSFVVVGRLRGEYGKTFWQEIEQLGMQERVRVISGADFKDFPALYKGAALSVYVSHFEGFGLPVLEAICCGTSVVAANNSSLMEAGGDAALYVEDTDAKGLSDAINQLISDEGLRKRQKQKGEQHKEMFRPKLLIEQMYDLYKSLINSD